MIQIAVFSDAGRFVGHCNGVDPTSTTVAQLRTMIQSTLQLVPYKFSFRGLLPGGRAAAGAQHEQDTESFVKVHRLLPKLTIRGAPRLASLVSRGCVAVDLPGGLGRVLNLIVLVAENPAGDPVLLERIRLGAEAPGRRIPANRFDGLDPFVAAAEDVASGGQTLLHELAASGSNIALERFVMNQISSSSSADGGGASFLSVLNRPDGAGRTPLWHAASRGLVNTVHVLLRAGADPLAAGCGAAPAAAAAAPSSSSSSSKKGDEQDKRQNEEEQQQQQLPFCALEAAIDNRHDAVVDTICSFIRDANNNHGADTFSIPQRICDTFVSGAPSLHQLAYEGDVEAVQFLTSHLLFRPYASLLSARDANMTGGTALHAAARGGSVEMVEHLVDRCGLHPDEPDERGNTPLFYAAAHGHASVVHALVIVGASVARLNQQNQSPLHVALASSSPIAALNLFNSTAAAVVAAEGQNKDDAVAAMPRGNGVAPGSRFAVLEELFRGLEAQPDDEHSSKVARVCDAVTGDSPAAICAARGDVGSLQRLLRVCGRSACAWKRPQRAAAGALPWPGNNRSRMPAAVAKKRKRNFGAYRPDPNKEPAAVAAALPRTALVAALDGIGAHHGRLARSKLECALLIAEGYIAGELKADEVPESAEDLVRCIAAALSQTGSNVNIGFSVAKALLTVAGAQMAAATGEALLKLLVPTRFAASVQWLCECKVASDPVSWKRALLQCCSGGTAENLKTMLATTQTISALPGWLQGQDGDELCAAVAAGAASSSSSASSSSQQQQPLALLDVLFQAGAVPARRAMVAAAKTCDAEVFRKVLSNIGGGGGGGGSTEDKSGAGGGASAMLDPDLCIAVIKELLAPLQDPTFKVRRRRQRRAGAALCIGSLLAAVGDGGAKALLLWDKNFASVFREAVEIAAGPGGTACDSVGRTTPYTTVVFPNSSPTSISSNEAAATARRRRHSAAPSSSASAVSSKSAATLPNGGGPQLVAAFVELLVSVADKGARAEFLRRQDAATISRVLCALSFTDDVQLAARLLQDVADSGVDIAATRSVFARWLVHGSGFSVLAAVAAGSTQRWQEAFDTERRGNSRRDTAGAASSFFGENAARRHPALWLNSIDLRPLTQFRGNVRAARLQSAFASPHLRRIVRALMRHNRTGGGNSSSNGAGAGAGGLREASLKNLIGSGSGGDNKTSATTTSSAADFDAAVVMEWFLRFAAAQREKELQAQAEVLSKKGDEVPCASDKMVLEVLCDAARLGSPRVVALCAQWLLQQEQNIQKDRAVAGSNSCGGSMLRSAAFQQAVADAAAAAVCCTSPAASSADKVYTACSKVARAHGSSMSANNPSNNVTSGDVTTAGSLPSASCAAFADVVSSLLPLLTLQQQNDVSSSSGSGSNNLETLLATLPNHVCLTPINRASLLAVAIVWGSAAVVSEIATACLHSSSNNNNNNNNNNNSTNSSSANKTSSSSSSLHQLRERADAVIFGIESLSGDTLRLRLLDITRNLVHVQATAARSSRRLAETAALPRILPLAARLRRWDDVCELVLDSCGREFTDACRIDGNNDPGDENNNKPTRREQQSILSSIIADSVTGEERRKVLHKAWRDVIECSLSVPDSVRQLSRFSGVIASIVRRVPVTTAAQAAFVYAISSASSGSSGGSGGRRIVPLPRTEEARRVVACRAFAVELANPMTRMRKEQLWRAKRMAKQGYQDDDDDDDDAEDGEKNGAGSRAVGEDGGVNVFASACRAGMVDVARTFARLYSEYDIVRKYCTSSNCCHPHSNPLFCALRSGCTSIVYDAFDGTWPVDLTRSLLPSLDAVADAAAFSAVTPADVAFGLLRSNFAILPQLRHFRVDWSYGGGDDNTSNNHHHQNMVQLLAIENKKKKTTSSDEKGEEEETEEDSSSTPARRRAAAGGARATPPLRMRLSNKLVLISDSPVDIAAAQGDWTNLSELLSLSTVASAGPAASCRALIYGSGGVPFRFGSTLLLALFLLPRGNKAHRTRMERNVSVLWTQQQQQQKRNGSSSAEAARFEWILCLSLAVYHSLFDVALNMLDAATRDGTQFAIRTSSSSSSSSSSFLKSGVIPEPLHNFGETLGHPVFAAIANKKTPAELFSRLLRATPLADIESAFRNGSGHTALGFAILLRNGPRADDLLRFRSALATKPCLEEDVLPLLYSVRKGCDAVFNRCAGTAQSSDIAADGHALLLLACARGQAGTVEKIVSCGGDVHASKAVVSGGGSSVAFSSVMLAAAGGHDALATSLAANWHVSVAPSAAAGTTTALHCAIWGGCESLVSWLMTHVPHLALMPDVDGTMPLELSQSLGRIGITRKLHRVLSVQQQQQQQQSDPAASVSAGSSPAIYESSCTTGWFRNAMSIAQRMLGVTATSLRRHGGGGFGGASSGSQSPEYDTFISGGGSFREERALECGSDSAKLLARFAAAGNAVGVRALADFVGVDRSFALHRAAAAGHVDVCRLLLSLGCSSAMTVDDKGRTALEVAVRAGKTAVAEYLFAQLVASDGAGLFFEARIADVLRSIVEASSSSNCCRGDTLAVSYISPQQQQQQQQGGGDSATIAGLISRVAQVAVERGWAAPLHKALTAKTESFKNFSPLETALMLGCPECVMRILAAQTLTADAGGAAAVTAGGGSSSPKSGVVVLSDPALALVSSPMSCFKPSSRVLLFDVFGVQEAAVREADTIPHLYRLSFADVRLLGINKLFADDYLRSCVESIFTVNHEAAVFDSIIYEPIGPLPRSVHVSVDFSSPNGAEEDSSPSFVSVSPLAARCVATTLGVARFRDSQLVESTQLAGQNQRRKKRRVNQRKQLAILHSSSTSSSSSSNPLLTSIKVEFVDDAMDVMCCPAATSPSRNNSGRGAAAAAAHAVDRLCFHDVGRLLCLSGRVALLDEDVMWGTGAGDAAVKAVEAALTQECTDAWRTRFAKHPVLGHGSVEVVVEPEACVGTGAQLDRCEAALNEAAAILRRVLFDGGDFVVLDSVGGSDKAALADAAMQYKGSGEGPPHLTIRYGSPPSSASSTADSWCISTVPSPDHHHHHQQPQHEDGTSCCCSAPRLRDCRAWLRPISDLVKVQCCVAAYVRSTAAVGATAARCGFEFQKELGLPVAPPTAFKSTPTSAVAAAAPSPHDVTGCVVEVCTAISEVLMEQHAQSVAMLNPATASAAGSRSASAATAAGASLSPARQRRSASALFAATSAAASEADAGAAAASAARLPMSLRKVKVAVVDSSLSKSLSSTNGHSLSSSALISWSEESGTLTVHCSRRIYPSQAEIISVIRARLEQERLQRTLKHVETAVSILQDRLRTLFPHSVCEIEMASLQQRANAAGAVAALAETYSGQGAVKYGTPISALGDALGRARAAPFGQDLVHSLRSVSIVFCDSEFLKVRRLRRFDEETSTAASSSSAAEDSPTTANLTRLRFFVPIRSSSRNGGATASRAFDAIQTANDWFEELLVAASTAINMSRYTSSHSGAAGAAVTRRFEPLRSWLSLHSAARQHSGYIDVQLMPRDPFGEPIALPLTQQQQEQQRQQQQQEEHSSALDDPVLRALFDATSKCSVQWFALDDEIIPAKVLKVDPLVMTPPAAVRPKTNRKKNSSKKNKDAGKEQQQQPGEPPIAADRLLLRIEVPKKLSISGSSVANVGFKLVINGNDKEQQQQQQEGDSDYYVIGRVPGAAVSAAASSRMAEWRWSFDDFNTAVAETEAVLVLHWVPEAGPYSGSSAANCGRRRLRRGASNNRVTDETRNKWRAAHPTLVIDTDDSTEANPAGLSLLSPPAASGAAASAAVSSSVGGSDTRPSAHTRIKLRIPPLRQEGASHEKMRVALNVTLLPNGRSDFAVSAADAATTYVVRFDVNVWSEALFGDWQRACNVEISDYLWKRIAQRPAELEKIVSDNERRALNVFSRRAGGATDLLQFVFPVNYYLRQRPRVVLRSAADLAVRVAIPGSEDAARRLLEEQEELKRSASAAGGMGGGGGVNIASARRDRRRRELEKREAEEEEAEARERANKEAAAASERAEE